jgi:hypothetical protein
LLKENEQMDELFPLFEPEDTTKPESAPLDRQMSGSQRDALKTAFAALGILDARGQFAIVEELTGKRITSVKELQERDAQTLIHRLAAKVNAIGRRNTGNTWDDREEDTWIDKL